MALITRKKIRPVVFLGNCVYSISISIPNVFALRLYNFGHQAAKCLLTDQRKRWQVDIMLSPSTLHNCICCTNWKYRTQQLPAKINSALTREFRRCSEKTALILWPWNTNNCRTKPQHQAQVKAWQSVANQNCWLRTFAYSSLHLL